MESKAVRFETVRQSLRLWTPFTSTKNLQVEIFEGKKKSPFITDFYKGIM